MSLEPNLTLQGNWDFLWSGNFARGTDAIGRKIPIPEIIVPVLADTDLIAVRCDSNSAPDRWVASGWISGWIPDATYANSPYLSRVGGSQRLYLFSTTQCRFGDFGTPYQLRINAPRYLDDFQIEIYEYIGLGEPSIAGKLNAIHDQILQGQV